MKKSKKYKLMAEKMIKQQKYYAEKMIKQHKYYADKGLEDIYKSYLAPNSELLMLALSNEEISTNGKELTKNNHIFAARYYSKWASDRSPTAIKRTRKERKNLLIPRECKVVYQDEDEVKDDKLDNFMAKDCFFLQSIENMFNKYAIQGEYDETKQKDESTVSYPTEYIPFIEDLQNAISLGLVDHFYMFNKKSDFNLIEGTHQVTQSGSFEFIEPLPHVPGYPQQRCNSLYNDYLKFPNGHLDIYIRFFKARQFIWNVAEEKNNLTVNKIFETILSDPNPFKNYHRVMSGFAHYFINFAIRCQYPASFLRDLKANDISLYEKVRKQLESNVVLNEKNQKATLDFIRNINPQIFGLDFDNSFIYKSIISNFLIDKLNSYVDSEEHYGSLCLYLETPLKTKENPILIEKITREDSIDLIKKGLKNSEKIKEEYDSLGDEEKKTYLPKLPFITEDVTGEYQDYAKETEVSFLALTPNILLIHGENWFCDFLTSFYRIGQQDKIVDMYEKLYAKTSLVQNDKIILKVFGMKGDSNNS